jgi:nitroimidazol reductase NimA-like FMN-containing flavoprotein (pyridoxamine 5'-phosphate oxidase superfamily)
MRRKDREITEINEIEKIFLQCKTCHVAMVNDGIPYVVPLSYGFKILHDNTLELYFHSALEGKKIDILKKNNKVCFEVAYEGQPVFSDTPCNSGYYFESIIGNGEVIFIDDINKKCEALSIMFKHQSGKEIIFTTEQVENICIFKIISSDFTGKRKQKPNINC